MFAVMGITGQVGGATARALLAAGKQVRAIVRNPEKAAAWKDRGAEIAVADFDASAALADAFRGTEGVFAMLAPNFAPSPDFREARKAIASLRLALEAARPPKAVYLSSIGAEKPHSLGLITSTGMLEAEIAPLGIPSTFLRAAWFMENFAGDVQSARYSGEIDSYLQPEDKPFAMVATEDIGTVAAETLLESMDRQPRHRGLRPARLHTPRCRRSLRHRAREPHHPQDHPARRLGRPVRRAGHTRRPHRSSRHHDRELQLRLDPLRRSRRRVLSRRHRARIGHPQTRHPRLATSKPALARRRSKDLERTMA